MDNPFVTPTAGQSDWDSSLNADLGVLERGYHVTERAGVAINTGNVLWLNSGGFFFPYDPNSKSAHPHALAYTAASSGDSLTALAWGIVRSLGINSPAIPGFDLYTSTLTPGLIVTSPGTRKIGIGLAGYGVLFVPTRTQALAGMIDVNTSGVSDKKVLAWDDASSKWIPQAASAVTSGAVSLAALTDVDTTGLAGQYLLQWSNVTSKWQAQPWVGAIQKASSVDLGLPGMAVWLHPNGKIVPLDPNSETVFADMFTTQSCAAGASVLCFIASRISASKDLGSAVFSASNNGEELFVSALTPGIIVSSYAGCNRPVGYMVSGSGSVQTKVAYLQSRRDYGALPVKTTNSFAIAAVTGSLHQFSCSLGRVGWNRQTVMIGNSANLVELKWYADSAHTNLLYSTISGGVSVVGSFQDRAGWPWENTDASTLGDLVYGTVKIMSAAAVGSDTISVQQIWDRSR